MFNDKDTIYVFQEWATNGNLVEYMETTPPLSERKAAVWAKQVYRALDFLGDQAIAHRDLAPIQLVVVPVFSEVWLKLTGFSQSIIYWDINSNDVEFCQCWPAEKQIKDGPNFQPPEVYGNPQTEQFDPIQADIWSFGANIYYMLAKQYPYNVNDPYENIDEEIGLNINKAKISEDCKSFLFGLMRANANDRMPFDFIEKHAWMLANSMVNHLISDIRILPITTTFLHSLSLKRVLSPANMKWVVNQSNLSNNLWSLAKTVRHYLLVYKFIKE